MFMKLENGKASISLLHLHASLSDAVHVTPFFLPMCLYFDLQQLIQNIAACTACGCMFVHITVHEMMRHRHYVLL